MASVFSVVIVHPFCGYHPLPGCLNQLQGGGRRTTPGGQPRYSDLAIELVLMLRVVYRPCLLPYALILAGQRR
jgi:hypothetical protein